MHEASRLAYKLVDGIVGFYHPQKVDVTDEWYQTVSAFDDMAAVAAFAVLLKRHQGRPPTLNDVRIALQESARALRAEQAARRPRGTCGGDRWVEQADGLVPCPTCNEFLYSEWLAGTLNSSSGEKRAERVKMHTGRIGEPCPAVAETTLPPEQGFQVAWDAYAEWCYRHGREPNKQLFGSRIGGMPASSAPAAVASQHDDWSF